MQPRLLLDLLGSQFGPHLFHTDLALEHALGHFGKRAPRPPVFPNQVCLAGDRAVFGEPISAVAGGQRGELLEVDVHGE